MRNPVNTIEDMKKLLLGYRDNMRVEIESGIAVTAKTVADLRSLATRPGGLVLDIHVDFDPRLSVVTWSGHPDPTMPHVTSHRSGPSRKSLWSATVWRPGTRLRLFRGRVDLRLKPRPATSSVLSFLRCLVLSDGGGNETALQSRRRTS